MGRVDWVEVKERLKKAMDQGAKVLKEGSEGLTFVAGRTAHVIQLEFEIHQLKSRMDDLFKRLGEIVYRSKGGKEADEACSLRHDLDLLHDSLKKKQSEVRRTHLTATPKTKKSAKKKR